MKLIVASGNKGKLAEFDRLLAPLGVEIGSLGDYPHIGPIAETGTTFEENALIKAREVAAATGLCALADDSGIVVDALHGAPGVYSARYAGEGATDAANNLKLLEALFDVPEEKRGCRFVSVIAVVCPDGRECLARGEWLGRVLFEGAGEGGFGYDPLFFDPKAGKSAAEMSKNEKNSCSHRAAALAALMDKLPAFLAAQQG